MTQSGSTTGGPRRQGLLPERERRSWSCTRAARLHLLPCGAGSRPIAIRGRVARVVGSASLGANRGPWFVPVLAVVKLTAQLAGCCAHSSALSASLIYGVALERGRVSNELAVVPAMPLPGQLRARSARAVLVLVLHRSPLVTVNRPDQNRERQGRVPPPASGCPGSPLLS